MQAAQRRDREAEGLATPAPAPLPIFLSPPDSVLSPPILALLSLFSSPPRSLNPFPSSASIPSALTGKLQELNEIVLREKQEEEKKLYSLQADLDISIKRSRALEQVNPLHPGLLSSEPLSLSSSHSCLFLSSCPLLPSQFLSPSSRRPSPAHQSAGDELSEA
eukprot:205308-Hanusia_phi.AAC.4